MAGTRRATRAGYNPQAAQQDRTQVRRRIVQMSGRIGGGVADKATPGGRESSEGLGRTRTIRRNRKGLRPVMRVSVPKAPRAHNHENHCDSGPK